MLTFTDEEFRSRLQRETGIRPQWSAETFTDLDENVRRCIKRIEESPFIPRKNVRGFIYDVTNGSLREVDV